MDSDFKNYFVDAQGDVTPIGKQSSETHLVDVPRAADLRLRNFIFPAAANLAADISVSQIRTAASSSGGVIHSYMDPLFIPPSASFWDTVSSLKIESG